MYGDYNLRREKRYVEVDVRFTPDGKIRPLAINYDKTRTYGIDRVLAVRHGTSRLGGKGHCFTCLICGQKRSLWLEQGMWRFAVVISGRINNLPAFLILERAPHASQKGDKKLSEI